MHFIYIIKVGDEIRILNAVRDAQPERLYYRLLDSTPETASLYKVCSDGHTQFWQYFEYNCWYIGGGYPVWTRGKPAGTYDNANCYYRNGGN
jgi:hypothetical protein